MTLLWSLWALLSPAPYPIALERAIEQAESGGDPWARNGSHRGLWQVGQRYASPVPRALPLLLHVPAVGRAEGRRLLARWQHRCSGNLGCALRAYRCGNAGVRGDCGAGYAARLLAAAKG